MPAAFALVLVSSSVARAAVTIDHQPVGCVVADKFPRLEAQLGAGDGIASARILFQPPNGKHWYAVAMQPGGTAYFGVLPKPKKSLAAFRYYIEVTDRELGSTRTPEYTPRVAGGAGGCRDTTMATGLGSASVVLQSPPGAPVVPPGFAATGVVAASAAAAAGSVAAGAVAASAGGGGVGTGLILGGAAVVAAGAAVAVAAAVDDGAEGGGAASGTYTLERIDGAPLPVMTVTTPCIGFADSGTLAFRTSSYEITMLTRFECLNGPGPRNIDNESGRWSESGDVITFTMTGPSVFHLSTGTLSGATLTLSMDAPSGAPNVPARRVTATWQKQ